MAKYSRSITLFIAVTAVIFSSQFIFNACSGSGSSSKGKPVDGLVVTPGTGQVALKWLSDSNAKSYTIFWGSIPSGAGRTSFRSGADLMPNRIDNVTSTFYIHRGLDSNRKFFYAVVGDPDGNWPDTPGGSCELPNGCYFTTPFICNGVCVNVSFNDNNCGSCGNVCPAGTKCFQGACSKTLDNGCTANAPYSCTYSTESTSGSFCSDGSLPNACGSNCTDCTNGGALMATCDKGQCNTCADGEYSCQSGCANISYDSSNCGACGNVCPSGKVCQSGECITFSCSQGTYACPGIEGQLICTNMVDNQNCGACGRVCARNETCLGDYFTNVHCVRNATAAPAPAPTAAPATVVCGARLTNCGGACVNTNTDASNCGACGKVCSARLTCSAGACI